MTNPLEGPQPTRNLSAAPGYPHHLVGSGNLRDGRALRIRPIAPTDRFRHWRFICSLSLQTRYHRLMSARNLLPGELRQLVEIDYAREMALVAVTGSGDEEKVIGVARYVLEDPGQLAQPHSGKWAQPHPGHGAPPGPLAASGRTAEFAIVVADAWQRRGLGELLLRRLVDAGRAAGLRELAGITLATNVPMIRLAKKLGFEVSREPGDWTVKRITWRQASATVSAEGGGDSAAIAAGIAAAREARPIAAQ